MPNQYCITINIIYINNLLIKNRVKKEELCESLIDYSKTENDSDLLLHSKNILDYA